MGLWDLPACELKDKLLVRKQAIIQDSLGGESRSGPITDTAYPCEINDIQGAERVLFAQRGFENPSRVRLNANPGVSITDVVYLQADLTRPATVKDIRIVAESGEQWVLDVDEIRQG